MPAARTPAHRNPRGAGHTPALVTSWQTGANDPDGRGAPSGAGGAAAQLVTSALVNRAQAMRQKTAA